jgi:hypothetical protein
MTSPESVIHIRQAVKIQVDSKKTECSIHRQADRQAYRQTGRPAARQTGRQADRHTADRQIWQQTDNSYLHAFGEVVIQIDRHQTHSKFKTDIKHTGKKVNRMQRYSKTVDEQTVRTSMQRKRSLYSQLIDRQGDR